MDYKEEVIKRFQEMSNGELIEAFNHEVGQRGWTSSRATYMWALHREIRSRNFDLSAIIEEDDRLSFSNKISLVDNKLIIQD